MTFFVGLGTCDKELSSCLLRSGLFEKFDLNHRHFFDERKAECVLTSGDH